MTACQLCGAEPGIDGWTEHSGPCENRLVLDHDNETKRHDLATRVEAFAQATSRPPWARDVPMPNRVSLDPMPRDPLDPVPSPLPLAIISMKPAARLRRWILALPIIRWLYSPPRAIEYCGHCGEPLEGQERELQRRYGCRTFSVCIGRFDWAGPSEPKGDPSRMTCMHLTISWS